MYTFCKSIMTKRKRDDNTEQINVANLKKIKTTKNDNDNDIIIIPSVSQRVQEPPDETIVDLTKLPDETIDLTQLPDSPVKIETPRKPKAPPRPYVKINRKARNPSKKLSSNPFSRKTDDNLSDITRKISETQISKKPHSEKTPSPKNEPQISESSTSKATQLACPSKTETQTTESTPKTETPESTLKTEPKKRIRRCRRCGTEGCSKNRKTCPGKNLPKKLWFVGWFEDHYPENASNLHCVESFEVSWLGYDPKGKPWPNTWEPARQILNDTKTSPDLFKELIRYSSRVGLLKDENQNNVEYSENEIETLTDKTYTRYKYWSTVVRPFSSKQNPKVPLKSKNIPR
jgi:hypothetical protein